MAASVFSILFSSKSGVESKYLNLEFRLLGGMTLPVLEGVGLILWWMTHFAEGQSFHDIATF